MVRIMICSMFINVGMLFARVGLWASNGQGYIKIENNAYPDLFEDFVLFCILVIVPLFSVGAMSLLFELI